MLACISFGLASGCGPKQSTSDTHVAHHDLYKTSNFTYDEFFEDVYNLQKDSTKADDIEKDARRPFAEKAGAGSDVIEGPIDPLIELARQKAEQLAADKKLKLRLSLEGIDDQGQPAPGKTISVAGKSGRARPIPRDVKEWMDALEQTARQEGVVFDRFSPMGDKARRRIKHADELLSTVDRDFDTSPSEKRDAVRNELTAAKVSLGQIAETCDRVAKSALKFLRETSAAFDWAWSVAAGKGSKKGGAPAAKSAHPSRPKPSHADESKPSHSAGPRPSHPEAARPSRSGAGKKSAAGSRTSADDFNP